MMHSLTTIVCLTLISAQEHVLFKLDVWDADHVESPTMVWTDRMYVFLSGESGQSMSHVVYGSRANHPTRYIGGGVSGVVDLRYFSVSGFIFNKISPRNF